MGALIAIEGISGVGKTKHSRLLENWLKKNHVPTLLISEPSASLFGLTIKKAIIECNRLYHKTNPKRVAELEAMLFAADRVYQYYTMTLPALKNGKVVISDRSVYSSHVYQGVRGLNQKTITTLNKPILERPSLVIILDVDLNLAAKRLESKRSGFREFDAIFDSGEVLKKARKNYLALVRKNPAKFKLIRTQKPLWETQKRIQQLVYSHLKKRGCLRKRRDFNHLLCR